jgi:ribosomal-protein-alanine N-acetyltransferase
MNHIVSIGWKDLSLYAEQIIEIENSSFPSPWSINAFKEEIKKPISHLWALIQDKKILGYICFWMFDTEIQIINLAVRPENRRQKLGQSMLKRMIEAGSSNGLRSIWLEVRPSNVAARNLYTKFGFHEAGRRKRYYSDTNEDAIIMMLNLSPQERDKQNLGPFSKN